MLEADKRPVSAVADFTEVRDVVSVEIREDREIAITLLFDREHNLEERVLQGAVRGLKRRLVLLLIGYGRNGPSGRSYR